MARPSKGVLLVLGLVLGVSGRTPLSAQEVVQGARFSAVLEGTYVPVYEGDATVGSLSALGVTATVGVWVAPKIRIGTFLTHALGDADPMTALPELTYYGLMVGTSNIRAPGAPVSVFLEAGYGWMRVDDATDSSGCRLPCFAEGGPHLRDGTEGSVVIGAGVEARVFERLYVRGGGRWHVTQPPSEAGASFGLGLGIHW